MSSLISEINGNGIVLENEDEISFFRLSQLMRELADEKILEKLPATSDKISRMHTATVFNEASRILKVINEEQVKNMKH